MLLLDILEVHQSGFAAADWVDAMKLRWHKIETVQRDAIG